MDQDIFKSNIQEHGKMVKDMDQVILMDIKLGTMVIGKMTRSMDQAFSFIQMKYMQEHGKMIRNTEMVIQNIQMVLSILENGRRVIETG